MLVLVATTQTQGALPGDYAHALEGELVTPVVTQCDCPDCGCNRGFPGLVSGRATTTALVVDRVGVSAVDLRDAVREHLVRGGWLELLEHAAEHQAADGLDVDDPDVVLDELCDEHVDEITRNCEFFGEGAIVSRFDDELFERIVRRAA